MTTQLSPAQVAARLEHGAAAAKLMSDMELRFTSGNGVPVERAYIRADEWLLLRGVIARLRECGEVGNG